MSLTDLLMVFNNCFANNPSGPDMRIKNIILTILASLLLSSCAYESLYSNLDEQQVNEMLALLLQENIVARKKRLNKQWSLQTTEDDLPKAMNVLKSNGYPRERFQSLGEVFQKEGFVSSPLEEKARLLYGLSQELSNTLSTIDGVIVARVHIAIPEKNVFSEDRSPSSASVFIKHRVDAPIDAQLSAIKSLVVNSVEGLPYDKVTVTLFPSSSLTYTNQQEVSVVVHNWQTNALQSLYRYWYIVLLLVLIPVLLLVRRPRSKAVLNSQSLMVRK